jgi:hypothetical protein
VCAGHGREVDGGKALELGLAFTAKIALDHDAFGLNHLSNPDELVFRELTRAEIRINASVIKNFGCRGTANSIHVRERSFDALLVGDFDTEDTGHGMKVVGMPANNGRKVPEVPRGRVI